MNNHSYVVLKGFSLDRQAQSLYTNTSPVLFHLNIMKENKVKEMFIIHLRDIQQPYLMLNQVWHEITDFTMVTTCMQKMPIFVVN